MCSALGDVRFVPIADSCTAANSNLFNHLVGAANQRLWDIQPERLGGLQVDDHLDFRDLLDRQVGGLVALENAAGVDPQPDDRNRQYCHRNSSSRRPRRTHACRRPPALHSGQLVREVFGPASEECAGADHEPAHPQLLQLREDFIEVTVGAGIQNMEL